MNSKLEHLNCGTFGSFNNFTLDIYLPFPTTPEFKEYDISYFNCYRINFTLAEVKITESTIDKYKIMMHKELKLDEIKHRKRKEYLDNGFVDNSSYVVINLPFTLSSACEHGVHNAKDLEHDLQKYVKELYPDTESYFFENIHEIDFGKDLELSFIEPKILFGYEFFHLSFAAGLGAKLLIDKFGNGVIDLTRFYDWANHILEDVDGFNERAGKDYYNLFDLRTYSDLDN